MKKIAIFVDVQNIYYTTRDSYGSKLVNKVKSLSQTPMPLREKMMLKSSFKMR